LVYKKMAVEAFSTFTLAGNLYYNANLRQWKRAQEKRGYFVLKDNFLFIFKNEKGTIQDIIYLGDGLRLFPCNEEQSKRKNCFKLGELFLISTQTAEQYSDWMLALSAPPKWFESAEDPKVSKMQREEPKSPSVGDPKKESKEMKKQENGEAQPSFGVPLEELFAREGGVLPSFFVKMVQFLEAKGLHEEGLLRLSGSVAEINKMKEALQHGEDVDFNEHDPHAVTGLLKLFLRELPEPLIPEPYHYKSLEIMGNAEMMDDQKVVEVKMIIDQLPPENHAMLRALMNFLVQVNAAADKNKMNIPNLITCMVPTLKCVPGIFMYVIPNFDFIFDEQATEDPYNGNNYS